MEPATVTIQLEPADLQRFNRFAGRGSIMNWRGLIIFSIALLLIGGSFILRKATSDMPAPDEEVRTEDSRPAGLLDTISTLVPVVLCLGVVAFYYRRAKRPSAYEKFSPGIFQPNTYEILDSGLLCRSERGETLNFWHVIARFAETDQDFYVMLAAYNGHVLPKRCFPTREAAAVFANQIRTHLEMHAPAAVAAR